MKIAILAGGLGSRLSEETGLRPKPMVEIGGKPILWHIMKIYSHWGFNEFIILTGYKSHIIKDFFVNYYARYSDMTIDMSNNTVEYHSVRAEPWKVTILYTGPDTMTGGRLLQAKKFLDGGRFMLTYGDGVSDLNIPELIKHHETAQKTVTMTAVKPVGRFGVIQIDDNGAVKAFNEKKDDNDVWINGGFFVMEPEVFNYLDGGDATVLERKPFERMAEDGNLNAYKHGGFWQAMDTLLDKNQLTGMWTDGSAPWAVWEQK